jgi:hypothetical protein
MTQPHARIGRWLVVGLTAAILAFTFSTPAASAQTRPLPCNPLDPVLRCVTPEPTSTARCHDWAVATVIVAGREQVAASAVCALRGGERLQLRRVEPQGINPANLLLELVLFRSPFPPGPATQQVRIVHSEPNAGYTSVTILPDGPTLAVLTLSNT